MIEIGNEFVFRERTFVRYKRGDYGASRENRKLAAYRPEGVIDMIAAALCYVSACRTDKM